MQMQGIDVRKLRRMHIYAIGVGILGAVIIPLDNALDSTFWFLVTTILYILIVRMIADKYGRP